MKVHVRYMAQLRQAAGTPAEEVELDAGRTVRELLEVLGRRHDDAVRRMSSSALVFVNDVQADRGTLLGDGDRVTLLAPIAGG